MIQKSRTGFSKDMITTKIEMSRGEFIVKKIRKMSIITGLTRSQFTLLHHFSSPLLMRMCRDRMQTDTEKFQRNVSAKAVVEYNKYMGNTDKYVQMTRHVTSPLQMAQMSDNQVLHVGCL